MMMAQVPGGNKRGRFDDNCMNLSSSSGGGGCSSTSFDSFNLPGTKRIKQGGRKEKKDNFSEKVGALQQLVCPYGKTDTASVLQEASGYISFLHEQLQVLSAPYIRRPTADITREANTSKLHDRGLCLMPMSWTLKFAKSNGADIWAPVTVSNYK